MGRGQSKRNIEILERGLEFIRGVEYKVSLRWLFYRLLQEGYYTKKEDYKNYKELMSTARHKNQCGWQPDMLADETRKIIYRTYGSKTVAESAEKLIPKLVEKISIDLDHFFHQKEFVMILFEARAMAQQFQHYTKEIDLLPFGGDVSIPLKFECAKYFQEMSSYYNKPVRIAYFGDLDDKGNKIYESAMRDIQKWCGCPINRTRCGLTEEQVERINKKPGGKKIPENPDKPGQYQWEALEDEDAAEIINQTMADFVDVDIVAKNNERAEKATEHWKKKIEKALEPLKP